VFTKEECIGKAIVFFLWQCVFMRKERQRLRDGRRRELRDAVPTTPPPRNSTESTTLSVHLSISSSSQNLPKNTYNNSSNLQKTQYKNRGCTWNRLEKMYFTPAPRRNSTESDPFGLLNYDHAPPSSQKKF
jgi:hypothetical protein